MTSKIEWTDETWNPITGCTPVSEGCKNCYAAGIAKRFWGDREFGDVRFHPERLKQPLQWKKPRRIFVCSMSDLFHEKVTDEQIEQVFRIMGAVQFHTFIVLTKRPQRMLEWTRKQTDLTGGYLNNGNVWLGVSAENQRTFDERVPELLKIPAGVRFVSLEPMLEPVDTRRASSIGLDWVIVGCESGASRRPCKLDWIEDVVDQCQETNIPCFVKQADIDGKIVHMPKILGQVWDQMPEDGYEQ